MDLSINDSLLLNQKLNQQQIQFLSLLKMPELELREYVDEIMLENPMIDISSASNTSNVDFHTWYQSAGYSEDTSNAFLNLVGTDYSNSLERIIWDQLDMSYYSQTDILTVTYLISCLDSKGFLPYHAQELAEMSGLDQDMLDFWITSLKELTPTGIFAFDISECLLLQLQKIPNPPDIAFEILRNHFDLFIANKSSQIAKKIHAKTADVKHACHILAKLSPYPNIDTTPQNISYIIPDIILTYTDNTWKITLNDSWFENYSLCDHYYQLMKETTDPDVLKYLKSKHQQAYILIENIKQRRNTLLRLTKKITDKQHQYLLHGGSLTPMTMTDIANELDLSPSTISRAVNSKFIQSPSGIHCLKNLFRSGYQNTSRAKTVCSSEIISQLKELIASEPKSAPYSDQWLAQEIAQKNNIQISRRTIAKYRELEGIPSTRERRY